MRRSRPTRPRPCGRRSTTAGRRGSEGRASPARRPAPPWNDGGMDAQDAAAAVVPLSIASIALILGAAAVVLVVHLAGTGRIGRNHLAGIRTRTLTASDDAWLRGHRAATPVSWLTGAIAVLAGLGALAAVLGGSVRAGL